jgi:hypothetical protein
MMNSGTTPKSSSVSLSSSVERIKMMVSRGKQRLRDRFFVVKDVDARPIEERRGRLSKVWEWRLWKRSRRKE